MRQLFHFLVLITGALAVTGCTSVSSNYTGAIAKSEKTRIFICHGFDCNHKAVYWVTEDDREKLTAIMLEGQTSPEAERHAIGTAVMYFEERAAETIGVRDTAKSTIGQSRERGQMDCIDESSNTYTVLRFLESNGWLKYHKVERNVSRGFLLDGRYPHSTAVIRDPTGQKWAVDSWFEPAGGRPDIWHLSRWYSKGIMGDRGS